MAEYLIQDTTLSAIADAVRSKTNKNDPIPVSEIANEISNISAGGLESVEKNVELDFSNGDMEIIPDDGAMFSKVSISQPATLIPENIMNGVNIAGIVGIRTSGSDRRIDYTYNESDEAIGATLYGCDSIYGCACIPTLEWVDTSNVTLKKIPDYAFYMTDNMEFNIPDSVESIGAYAFGYSGITTVTIPEGITTIQQYTFTDCNNLKIVNIPEGITTIGEGAFTRCKSLETIAFPDSVTTYEGNYTFYGASSLKSFTIGKNVTTLSYGMFYLCWELTSVVFENPSGWYVTQTKGSTSGTNISESQLKNASTAATLLNSTYRFYYWYRR